MGLVDLTTDLKSLRYGKDRVGGGNSNQPYVTKKIPNSFSKVGKTGGPDFLLRGGALLPKIVVNDVSRLAQMFFDFKSPSGPLFIAKQNVLSLTNVNSEAGYQPYEESQGKGILGSIGSFIKNNIALNQGIYTPLGTLAQAVGNGVGLHTNKQGLNPFKFKTDVGKIDGNSVLGLPTYLNTIATPSADGPKSRLFGLLDKVDTKQTDLNLYTYSGGPGAILGVGKTRIDMIDDQRTGINSAKLGLKNSRFIPQQFISNKNIFKGKDGFNNPPFSLSFIAPQLIYSSFDPVFASEIFREDYLDTRNPSVYEAGTLLKTDKNKLRSGILGGVSRQVWTQADIEDKVPFSKTGKTDSITNFTKIKGIAPTGSQFIPNSLNYVSTNKIENRVNLGDPGKRANRKSYTVGRQELGENWSVSLNSSYRHALDKINALPIYQSGASTTNNVKNDLVKFRIGVINNEKPNLKTYIHFRAHIDSFSDNFSADWDAQKFMGRGENFYKYQGFDRDINLSWTVAAQSKQELIPMHQKLNYLASVTAPSYSTNGYMGGNLISLTIGGWCFEQVGIMTGLNLEIPTDSPWEIAVPDGANPTLAQDGSGIKSDPSIKELPMIIKVTGFNFIPIHDFVPQVQKNDFAGGQTLKGGGQFVGKYGKEQYIGLATTGGKNNYSGGTGNLNYIPGRERVKPIKLPEPVGIQPIAFELPTAPELNL